MSRMPDSLKPASIVLVLLIPLIFFFSCRDFFGTVDLKEEIKKEVVVATADSVTLLVRPDLETSGGTTSLATTTQKVGIPFSITATPFPEYAFSGWTEISDGTYVSFSSPGTATTNATITSNQPGLVIQANFVRRPEVEATDPGNDSENVITNKRIMIYFTKAMDPDSVILGNITITAKPRGSGDAAIPINDQFDEPEAAPGSMLFTITPKNPLEPGYMVSFRISRNVRDAQGNTMANDVSRTFYTGNQTDTTPPQWEVENPFTIVRHDSSPLGPNNAVNSRQLLLRARAYDADSFVQYLDIEEVHGGETHTQRASYQQSVAYTLMTPGEGQKNITVRAVDSSNNISEPKIRTVFFDNTAPGQPSIASQTGGHLRSGTYYYRTGGVVFTPTANDNAGGSGIHGYSTSSSGLNPASTVTLSASGSIYAVDNAGNVSSGLAVTVVQDNTPPTVTVGAILVDGSAGSWVRNGQTITIPVTVTDAGAGMKAGSLEVSLAGRTMSISGSAPDFTASYTIPAGEADLAEGALNYSLSVEDNVGNIRSIVPTATGLEYDRTPPTISLSAASASPVKNGTQVSFTVSYGGASEITLAQSHVSIQPTGDASAIFHTISGTGTASRTVTLTTGGGNGTVSVSINAESARDHAGNQAPASSASVFTVDNAPPVVTIGAPSRSAANSANAFSYQLVFSEAVGAVNAGKISLNRVTGANGTVTVTKDTATTGTVTISNASGNGSLGITVEAGAVSDTAGNENAETGPSATVIIDNTAPGQPSIASQTGGHLRSGTYYYRTGGVVFIPTANDNAGGSGIQGYSASSAGLNPAGTVTLSASGSIYAVDNAGNVSSGLAVTVAQDNTPPTVTIGTILVDGSAGSWVRNGQTITIPVTVTDAGAGMKAGSLEVSLAGRTMSISGSEPNFTASYTIPAGEEILPEGALNYSLSVEDNVGNLRTIDAAISGLTYDRTPPTISLSAASASPVNAAGSLTYTVSFNEDITISDAEKFRLNLSGVTVDKTVNLTDNRTATVTISNASGNGSLSITVEAGAVSDTAGNQNAETGPSATVIIDNIPPTITGTLTATADTISGFVTADTDGSGIDASTYTASGSGSFNGTILTSLQVLADPGSHDYVISVKDLAGNLVECTVRYSRIGETYTANFQ